MDHQKFNPADNVDLYFVSMTADLASAFVTNNSVKADDLSKIIKTIHTSLKDLLPTKASIAMSRPVPPVPIKKTVTPDYIVSLEDGKPYKSLKRHLSRYGMTPQQYREKWGLPQDYPMVSPAYSAKRSELSRAVMGLGRNKVEPANDAPVFSKRGHKTA